MKKRGYHVLSCILFILGLIFLEPNQQYITGAFLGVSPFLSSLLGVVLWITAGILFITGEGGLEKKVKLVSMIKRDESIRDLAIEATRNQKVKEELDHLIYELSKGHLAGLAKRGHIKGTDIFYLRGRKGGRLYYHKIKDSNDEVVYEIVGKSGKGRNQIKVIRKLAETYMR